MQLSKLSERLCWVHSGSQGVQATAAGQLLTSVARWYPSAFALNFPKQSSVAHALHTEKYHPPSLTCWTPGLG
jgi:hypothetical protein